MLIGVDVSRTAEAKTGLASYACSLIDGMARVDHVNQYLLYPFVWDCFPPGFKRAFRPRQSNFRMARRFVPEWLIEKLWANPHVDKKRVLGGDPDVFLSPFHSVPARPFRRLVCVFHDVSFRVHPEFSGPENLEHCEHAFARAITSADHVVTVSHFSKAEMVKHMGVPADWISVTHEAADPMYRPIADCPMPERIRRDIGAPDQTILYVGSVEPRKNLVTLIKAFDTLLQRGKVGATLVIAGGAGWKNSNVHAEIERRGLSNRVYFTGFVSDEELVQLYNTCSVFVFPTIYEGFGLPVIEAMQSGAPVVTTRVSSIPEVAGEAVAYVDDPFDDAGLCLRIEEVLTDAERAAELSTRGLAQAAKFTWDQTARETLAVLEHVVDDPKFRRRCITIGETERGIDRGWHGAEQDGQRTFRWIEREATAHLIAGPTDDLVVEAASSFPDGEQVLSIRVHGFLIGHAALDQTFCTYRLPMPEQIPRGIECRVELRLNVELPPAMKGSDPRSLGARITKLGFEPSAIASAT